MDLDHEVLATKTPQSPNIHEAAKKGNLEDLDIFLAKDPQAVHAVDSDSVTPLHTAALRNQEAFAARLLAARADPNHRRNEHSRAPLHSAAVEGATAAARVLLAAKADPSVEDNCGKTPLGLAKDFGFAEMVALLSEPER